MFVASEDMYDYEKALEFTSVLLAIVLGVNYALIAFENLALNRFGQWQFKWGWWIFDGDYLREYFYADVRLLALCALFCLIGALLFQSQVGPFWRHVLGRIRAASLPRNQPQTGESG